VTSASAAPSDPPYCLLRILDELWGPSFLLLHHNDCCSHCRYSHSSRRAVTRISRWESLVPYRQSLPLVRKSQPRDGVAAIRALHSWLERGRQSVFRIKHFGRRFHLRIAVTGYLFRTKPVLPHHPYPSFMQPWWRQHAQHLAVQTKNIRGTVRNVNPIQMQNVQS
jgi:hypothetical protein